MRRSQDTLDPLVPRRTDVPEPGLERGKFWRERVGCCSLRERQGLLTALGVNTRFIDAVELAEAVLEYGRWVGENPLYEPRLVTYEGVSVVEYLPKVRAMTTAGMCLFLGISRQTWFNYRVDPKFSAVCAAGDEMVYMQKFECASAGLLNAMIISRDLGLAERKELSGPGGAPLTMITSEMDPKEAAALYASTLNGE